MMILGLIAAVVAAFCWAVSAALYKQGSANMSPITANVLRSTPALAALVLIGFFLNIYPLALFLTITDFWLIIGSSIFAFVIGDVLYFISLQRIGISRATPLTAIYPLFVVVFQVVFLQEVIHVLMIFAALSAVIGVILLGSQLDPASSTEKEVAQRVLMVGAAAAIATAASWSVSIIMLSEVLETTHLILVAILRLVIALVVLTPLALGTKTGRAGFRLPKTVWLILGAGGVTALAAGYIAFTVGILLAGTTPATILSSLTPLFAAVIGWRSLHEKLSWRTLAGILACILGIVLTAIAVSLV
jgi:DME family drug/metabolite transporter